jgi:DNA polymerase-3 subunit beta
MTLSLAMLHDITRKLPDGLDISLVDDNGHVAINAGLSNFTLPSLNPDDYPKLSTEYVDDEAVFTVKSSLFSQGLEKTKICMSNDPTRHFLAGIFLHKIDDKLRFVSTDGHRLALAEINSPKVEGNFHDVIIPKKTVAQIKKLADDDSDVEVKISSNFIEFQWADKILISKTIDGKFPQYAKVIPKNNDKEMVIDTITLEKAVDRVATLSNDQVRGIKFCLSSNKLSLSASDIDKGEAVEEIGTFYSNAPVSMGFDAKVILEVLGQVDEENFVMEFLDPSVPVIARGQDNISYFYVLMPIQV